jgi:DNA polymerase-3 subunit chi
MTRIDFYILNDDTPSGRERFACRLAEKAFTQGCRIYIHTEDAAQTGVMDQLLWTFRAGSFLPHECVTGDKETDEAAPIHLGYGEEPHTHDDVLINLAREVPLFFSRFQRVAEVIDQGEEQRQLGRERFRFYRERGYPLDTHNIGSR